MAKLCVNIDHVATVREARKTYEPDPVAAAMLAELGGAAGITCHLREDRRHANDTDVRRIREAVRVRFNLEMAASEEMFGIAAAVKPDMVTLVPENRAEITTEGGLDAAGNLARLRDGIARMHGAGIEVSLFIDPDERQIEASKEAGADTIELHTGSYANAARGEAQLHQLRLLISGGAVAQRAGLHLNSGHGLTLRNVLAVAAIAGMRELHIGHSIVAHAVMVGFERATREMADAIVRADELSDGYSPEEILRYFGA
jgi:pyridoxine 5-phosphate synthase